MTVKKSSPAVHLTVDKSQLGDFPPIDMHVNTVEAEADRAIHLVVDKHTSDVDPIISVRAVRVESDVDETVHLSVEKYTPDGSPAIQANLEVWKTIVAVQQHFNTIGWQIRALAITALTFTLGATFFGYLNADNVTLGEFAFNPSGFVPVLGLTIWLLFWFADGIWYHRLLSGAGRAAGPVEELLQSAGVNAGLSGAISDASHKSWLRIAMTSTRKLHIFYVSGIVILVLTAAAIFFLTGLAVPAPAVTTPTPTP